ncbi:MAG: amino acid adenylation domain-containing protein [Chitinophagaceae bacterium]
MTNKYSENNELTGFEIAVIGMAARFPGAENIGEFWANLLQGKESITFFSEEELLKSNVPEKLIADENYIPAKGIVDGVEYFDAELFGVNATEAVTMDPQSRLICETAYAALENAGCRPGNKDLIGVYIAAAPNINWQQDNFCKCGDLFSEEFAALLLNDKDFLSTRLSYLLNLKGPSMSLYTACSSSLVTVDAACQSLLTGKCDVAVAGAVSVSLPVKAGYKFEPGMIMSKDGHTRSFDKSASGSVFGDGVGVLILKRLADAINDRDHIHCVIKGSGINNDGSSKIGYTAPSSEGQQMAIRMAYEMAGVDPASVSYIEAHGSGTYIGDRIELEALNNVFNNISPGFKCPIGSVKSNFGHLNTAAGMAGIIKTILVLKHKLIPPSLHCIDPIDTVTGEQNSLYVNSQLNAIAPQKGSQRLRAGVSSFGIGGTNVHIVLEESIYNQQHSSPTAADHFHILPFSANSETALQRNISAIADWSLATSAFAVSDIAFTLQTGRKEYDQRKFLIVSEKEELHSRLNILAGADTLADVAKHTDDPVVMIFPGMGNSFRETAGVFYSRYPVFKNEVDNCLESIWSRDPSLAFPEYDDRTPIAAENSHSFLKEQLSLFVFEYALTRWLMKGGITPAALLGYSLGEYTAACIAGVFSLNDAIYLLLERGRLVEQLPLAYMLSVPVAASELAGQLPPGLSIVIDNRFSVVVGGAPDVVAQFEQQCKKRRLFTFRVSEYYAMHCEMPEAALDKYRQCLTEIEFARPAIPFISNVSGTWISESDACDPEYWLQHMTKTVQFSKNIETLLSDFGKSLIVETGPGNDLTLLIRRSLDDQAKCTVLNTAGNDQIKASPQAYFLQRLGTLWCRGISVNWEVFQDASGTRSKIELPSYSFDKQYFPVDLTATRPPVPAATGGAKKKDIADWFYLPSWRKQQLAGKQQNGNERTILLITAPDCAVTEHFAVAFPGKCVQVIRDSFFSRTGPLSFTISSENNQDIEQLLAALSHDGIKIDTIIEKSLFFNAPLLKPGDNNDSNAMSSALMAVVQLLRAFDKGKHSRPSSLLFLGTNLFNIAGNEPLAIQASVVAGLAKVIPQELAGIRCQVIDATINGNASLLAMQLLQEITSAAFAETVSFRGRNRWVLDYEPVRLTPPTGMIPSLRENGIYLITGGLGNIGRAIALFLHENCNATIVLCGRSALPQRSMWQHVLDQEQELPAAEKIRQLLAMEKNGAKVLYYQCDVSDSADLKRMVAAAEKEVGMINGVFHAAGQIDRNSFPTLSSITTKDFKAQFDTKVSGTLNLHAVFQEKSLDFVLLTSSLSPILGGLGLSAYASSNQFLDSIAQHLSSASTRWIAVNWADWSGWETKMEGFLIGSEAVNFNISAEEGIETLKRILAYGYQYPQLVVSSAALDWRLDKWVRSFGIDTAQQSGTADQQNISARLVKKRPSLLNEYTAPGTKLEQDIAGVWQQVLGYELLGVEDDFMELGGDSLKAITMLTRLRQMIEITVPLDKFFKTRTVRAIAAIIENSSATKLTPIAKLPVQDSYPLAPAQRRLFFLREFDASKVGYNETHVDILQGEIDTARLETAFLKVIQRHDILRSVVEMTENGPMQRVMKEVPFKASFFSLKSEEQLDDLIHDFIRPFDFNQPPFLRIGIADLGNNKTALILDRHHIVSDMISSQILIKEVICFYLGLPLPDMVLQYTDFIAWQEQESRSDRTKIMADFWKQRFSDDIPLISLPADKPRKELPDFSGSVCKLHIDENVTGKLKDLALKQNVTVNTLLMGIVNVWLSKITGQEDIVIGSPTAGRDHPDLEDIIGVFINTLPLRNMPEGQKTFTGLLQEIAQNTFQALENQGFQYEDLLEELNLSRNFSRNPLFDVMFVYHNNTLAEFELPGITRHPYRFATRKSKLDLNIVCWENHHSFDLEFEYSTALFSEASIRNWVGYFNHVLSFLLENPESLLSEVTLIGDTHAQQQLYDHRGPEVAEHLGKTLQQLFEEQVRKTPGETALVGYGVEFSYTTLNGIANSAAIALRVKKVKRNDIVGLFTGRTSGASVIGMLAIIKAGGAYLPVDPALPASRCQYMLEDAGVNILLTDNETDALAHMLCKGRNVEIINLEEQFFGSALSGNPDNINLPGDVVYAIYTSGSTGTPKGILLKHLNGVNLTVHCTGYADLAYKRVLQFSTISFDVSFSEIFYTICTGGTVYLISDEDRKDLLKLFAHISFYEISTVFLPMSLLRVIFSSEEHADLIPGCIRHIQTAGEQVIINGLFRSYLNKNGVWLHNHYGPSETHVVTTLSIDPNGDIPSMPSIGYPVINTDIYILDRHGKVLPAGIPGELWVGGAQVGSGYLGRPDLTGAAFRPDILRPDQKMYNTGDLACLRQDGRIDFFGRKDGQVKIRGHRVEPLEIESCLLQLPEVQQAVVKVNTDSEGEKSIIAYLVTNDVRSPEEIRDRLSTTLPDYMIPAHLLFVQTIPVTNSGKIDYRLLPDPSAQIRYTGEKPGSILETELLQLWSEILKTSSSTIGVQDNFFSIGGHSLKAMQLLYSVEKKFQRKIALPDFFSNSTIRKMARLMERRSDDNTLVITPAPLLQSYPATFFQQRLYYIHSTNPTALNYNMPSVFTLTGKVDLERLLNVFRKCVKDYSIFRTNICVENDTIVQQIHDQIDWDFDLLQPVTADCVFVAIRKFIRPFHLESDSLLRAAVVQVTDQPFHFLLIDTHHAIFDGYTLQSFLRTVFNLYSGVQPTAASLEYKDYAYWEQQTYVKEILPAQLQYWQHRLSGYEPSLLGLPYDYTRPEEMQRAGDSVHHVTDQQLYQDLRRFCARNNCTLYSFLVSTTAILLSRITGDSAVLLGSPVAGRRQIGAEGIWGALINMIPVYVEVDPTMRFDEFLQTVQENLLNDFQHQELSLDKIAQLVDTNVHYNQHQLFSTVLELDYIETGSYTAEGLTIQPYDIPRIISKFDLTVYCRDIAGTLHIEFNYATELFKHDTIELLQHYFVDLMGQLISADTALLGEISVRKVEA